MKPKKQVILRRRREVPIIDLSGDFSDSIKEVFIATYEEACQSHPENIIIKFDEEGHIYSSGISILIGLVGEAVKKGQKIHVTGLSEHFVEVFQFVGLTKYINVFPSESEALESFTQVLHL